MSNRGAISADSIRRNDWGSFDPPVLGGWIPSLDVTVVIADETEQDRLEHTLASLAHQTYPADLFEVVVVDAEARDRFELPKLRPERCLLVDAAGRAPFPTAVAASSSKVIIRLPAGAVVAPELVAALVRWQHVTPEAVSIATLAEIASDWSSAEEISDRAADGTLASAAPAAGATPSAELTKLLAGTHDLRTADHLAFLAVAGMPFAFARDRYEPGTDPYEGADIEVGYRLAQAGAVFLPEPHARAWAVGADRAALARRQRARLANLLPYPRGNRGAGGRTWAVPLVTAVVPADGPYETVRSCVDRLLGGQEGDLRVLLVGDWENLPAGSGEDSDLGLLAAEYRAEPRVRLVTSEPTNGFPSPYLLRVPSRLGVGPATVRSLITSADRWQAGLVRVLPAAASSAAQALELWRTAALSRALRVGAPVGKLPAVVGRTHGERWETGSEYDVVDLTSPKAARAAAAAGRGAGRPTETIAVGGARSLAKATTFVARRYARAAKRRIVRR
ncbi:hypothetical protein AB0J86_19370 [Micromonospora sp. NPDC049559]|uniref:hypothetical protein n=1 Tax=Micromonospora sp. NPDC049559 TaxID=3155923 RepID=UPI0034310176